MMETITKETIIPEEINWVENNYTWRSASLPEPNNHCNDTKWFVTFVIYRNHYDCNLQVEWDQSCDTFTQLDFYDLGKFPTVTQASYYAELAYKAFCRFGNFSALPYCEPV